MSAAERVLIVDSDMEHCKVIKYALGEYGVGAYYALSVEGNSLNLFFRALYRPVCPIGHIVYL